MLNNEDFIELLSKIKTKKPLIHHITNYVTANDSANIVHSIGASPIMADAIEEVEEIVSKASSLVINMGTLNSTRLEAMLKAGKKANELGIPVILDPVGVGATTFRKDAAFKLLKEIKFSVIKGNLSEIKALNGMDALSKGVDSEELDSENSKEVVKALSQKLNTIVASTGEVDYISDGNRIAIVKNGHKMLSEITGTGCMSTSLIGAYSSVTKDYFSAAIAGITTMGIAGEIAYEKLSASEGNGSFKVYLLDAVYRFSATQVASGI